MHRNSGGFQERLRNGGTRLINKKIAPHFNESLYMCPSSKISGGHFGRRKECRSLM